MNEYELKKQKKLEEERQKGQKKSLKHILKIALMVISAGGAIGGAGWYIASRPPTSSTPPDEVISRSGLHWHPELSITVKGQKQEIGANIGIGVTHNPIHTHDSTGVLHLEFQGLVRKNDLKLDKFFEFWDKQFNSNCILDSCNGPDGKLKMLVNGEDNAEFENYQMKDKDKIEIIYE